jgi:ferredoxin
VANIDVKAVGELTIQIDRDLCVGFGDCVAEAGTAFVLDESGVACFAAPDAVDRDRLIRACEVCPVDALSVVDESGRHLVP